MARDDKGKLYLLACFVLSLSLAQFLLHYNAYHEYLVLSIAASKRRKKERILWSDVMKRISNTQFRQMFRMTREAFSQLCGTITESVGEKEFKSEYYISTILHNKDQLYMGHCKTSGGWISGETKLGITLRLLAGGDSYDLGVLFDISPKHCNVIMHYVLKHWIIKTNLGNINFREYLEDNDRMNLVSHGFSKRSNGVF